MAQTRDDILQAALRLFQAEGAAAVTMRRVAAAVGVTPTALYYHFEGKEALLAALHRQALSTFQQYLHLALEGETSRERFQQTLDAYLRFSTERPGFYDFLFLNPDRPGRSQYPEDFARMRSASFRFLVDRVRDSMDAGTLRKADASEVALTIAAHAHGLVMLARMGHFEAAPDAFPDFFRASMEQLMQGLA